MGSYMLMPSDDSTHALFMGFRMSSMIYVAGAHGDTLLAVVVHRLRSGFRFRERAMSPICDRRSFRMRLLIWRARLSVPSLLGQADERKVISFVTALNGGVAIMIIGLFAWLSDLPLVFPALGPTAFILFSTPFSAAAAPRSVIIGHLTGFVSGYAAWRGISYLSDTVISFQTGGWPLLCSGSIALAITCLLLVRFSCPHPPACASALVVALGGVPSVGGLLYMAAAVVLVTAQAVAINEICCLSVPLLSPRDRDESGCRTSLHLTEKNL